MDNISFTSAIRPVTSKEFSNIISAIGSKNSVNYPWTIKESIKSQKAYTTGIRDCSVLGITDGKDVFLMHLCPTKRANRNYHEIRQFISKKMDLKNPNLQAILIGSKDVKYSEELYNKLAGFMYEWNIPLSELKSSSSGSSINVAYSALKDEWFVTCKKIDSMIRQGVANSCEILKSVFKKVKISDVDDIC